MTLGDINQLGRLRPRREDGKLPSIVEDILNRLAGMQAEGFEDRDPDRILGGVVKDLDEDYGDGRGRGSFNMIPSKSKWRGCTDLLVTFCFNGDSFEKRLRQCLDHVSQHCKDTKEIYFITTKWNSTVFENFQGYLDMVRDVPVNIVFIYVGMEGFVHMPE